MMEAQSPDSSVRVNDIWPQTQDPAIHQESCSFELMTNILVQKLCFSLKLPYLLIIELLPLTAWQE